MNETYRVLHIKDEALEYKVKLPYHVMKYAGATKTKPVYRLLKQFRTEREALSFIKKQTETA